MTINTSDRFWYVAVVTLEFQAVRVRPHPNVVNVRFAHIMGFCSDAEEYFCFEDFVTGRDLGGVIADGQGELYNGSAAEVGVDLCVQHHKISSVRVSKQGVVISPLAAR